MGHAPGRAVTWTGPGEVMAGQRTPHSIDEKCQDGEWLPRGVVAWARTGRLAEAERGVVAQAWVGGPGEAEGSGPRDGMAKKGGVSLGGDEDDCGNDGRKLQPYLKSLTCTF